ncbi:hypothetical protein NKG94_31990 [Micromonospora sp. M12]
MRESIIAEHRTYQQGLMWFLANDPRLPASVRDSTARWGCRSTSSSAPAAGRHCSTSGRPAGWSPRT